MKILNINSFAFKAMPKNYAKIDNSLSRSAQPEKEDFAWLKSQGVTDVINFRTMAFSNINFDEEKEVKAKHGLFRALIANMVKGVTEGFSKSLMFKGVGYKLSKNGNKLVMDIGYSHPKSFEEVEGITLEILSNEEVAVKGIDNELVGKVAAQIRAIRPVEPYHMYGIRYKDEVVIRKVSKNGKK